MLKLGLESLWNRRFIAGLSILSIALSAALILGVEKLRNEARAGFASSASGVDLIVAARGNPVQILLASIFGIGATGNTVSWDSFETVEALPEVAWAVPVSTGDNHRGFPVLGTTTDYFERFRFNDAQRLEFRTGNRFADASGAVLGAEVAERFGYAIGTEIILAHGAGTVAFDVHDDAPFFVTGILKRTGAAVDRMIFMSMEGFDGLHSDSAHAAENDPLALSVSSPAQDDGAASEEPHDEYAPDHLDEHTPQAINAILVGLNNRAATLSVQRQLSTYDREALTAVMPNVALLELWAITGAAEAALRLMAAAVVAVGIVGMLVMLSATVEPRRREFAILRSVGASPRQVFGLIVLEAVIVTLTGIIFGIILLTGAAAIANPVLAEQFGLRLSLGLDPESDLPLLLLVLACAVAASFLPAARVYRMTLSDGLAMKL